MADSTIYLATSLRCFVVLVLSEACSCAFMLCIKIGYNVGVSFHYNVSPDGHLGCNHVVSGGKRCNECEGKWNLELFDIVTIELDFRADQTLYFLRVNQFFLGHIIRQTKLGTDGHPIGNDKSYVVWLICSADDNLGNETTHTNGFFNRCRTYVFAILEFVQLFESAGDKQKAIIVKFPKVAGVESDLRLRASEEMI
jgi:hypothetical protein